MARLLPRRRRARGKRRIGYVVRHRCAIRLVRDHPGHRASNAQRLQRAKHRRLDKLFDKGARSVDECWDRQIRELSFRSEETMRGLSFSQSVQILGAWQPLAGPG
jgi:hypothetical protein